MTTTTWRSLALGLAALCCYQRWQSCTSEPSEKPVATDRRVADYPARLLESPSARAGARAVVDAVTPPTKTFYGFKIPARIAALAPQPGETMRAYRDRVLPLAELAIAPQRARVALTRDDFGLDAHQRAELDAAVQQSAAAIEDRVMNEIASGELRPATFKPMTGVTMARDLLDIVDHGNTRFLDSLTPEQRTKLAGHHFDFADYLMFSAPWEDSLHVLD